MDWPEALQEVVAGLRRVTQAHGAAALAALVSPTLTLEELHLATKLARGLGTDSIDHHFRALDSRARFAGARCLAVLGVTAYRGAFGRPKAALGRQPELLGEAVVWVLPNPSGLNAHETVDSLAAWYGAAAEAAGVPLHR